MHGPSLLREFIAASLLLTVIGVTVALAFWVVTGISPWPFVILAEVAGFGWGAVLLAISSPRSRR